MRPPTLFPSQEENEWLRLAARDIRLAELALGDTPPLAPPTREEALPWLLLAKLVWREVAQRLPSDPLAGPASGA